MAIRKIEEKALKANKQMLYGPLDYWLYDIVRNKQNEIVALCFHPNVSHTNCLNNTNDRLKLIEEGLTLSLSKSYSSLEEAKKGAWLLRDNFHKSLD